MISGAGATTEPRRANGLSAIMMRFFGHNHCGLDWEAVDNGVLIFVLGRPGSSLGRAGDDANERVTLGGGSS